MSLCWISWVCRYRGLVMVPQEQALVLVVWVVLYGHPRVRALPEACHQTVASIIGMFKLQGVRLGEDFGRL